jgi:hypothetical protein
MKMGLSMNDYDTMNGIVKDLSADDIEQLEEFAHDCEMVGAKRTAKYVRNQIRHEAEVLIPMLTVKLTEDENENGHSNHKTNCIVRPVRNLRHCYNCQAHNRAGPDAQGSPTQPRTRCIWR